MKRQRISARRRVRTSSALFLTFFSLAGLTLLRLIPLRGGASALLSAGGTLLFCGLPAALGLLVVDGRQTHLLANRALSSAQVLWLGAVGALCVCPMSLFADVLTALAGKFGVQAASGGAQRFALMPALVQSVLLAPLCEELFFRGYLLGVFSRYGRAQAAAATALLFALAHGANPAGQAAFGLLLAGLVLRTGSLLAGLLVHASYNLTLLLLTGAGLGGLFSGLTPQSSFLRLLGCGVFVWTLRRAVAAKGTRAAVPDALRVGRREVLALIAALLAVSAAWILTEVLR